MNTILLAAVVACAVGIAVLVHALARAERRADEQFDRDARIIARLHGDLRALVDENDDREHRELELEAVVARKNEENETLAAVALEHADWPGVRTFARLPHEQWPATVNGTRP